MKGRSARRAPALAVPPLSIAQVSVPSGSPSQGSTPQSGRWRESSRSIIGTIWPEKVAACATMRWRRVALGQTGEIVFAGWPTRARPAAGTRS